MLLSLVALVSAGIYPDDLFSSGRSVTLNSETFDDHIAAEVASGRYVAKSRAAARARGGGRFLTPPRATPRPAPSMVGVACTSTLTPSTLHELKYE